MEWVIGIVVVALVAVFVLPALAGAGLAGKEARGRESARASAPRILDAIFGQDKPTVTYNARPWDSIPADTVIAGAIERGWTLVSNDEGRLVFTRTVA